VPYFMPPSSVPPLIFTQRAALPRLSSYVPLLTWCALALAGADPFVFAAPSTGSDSFRTFAHLAFCPCAILRLEAAEILVWLICFWDDPEPFNDSMTDIA